MAGLAGVALTGLAIRLVTTQLGGPGAYWIEYSMDGRVLALVAATCLAAGLACGVAPALHASRTNVIDRLKDGGRTGSGAAGLRARRWATGLLTAEVALTLVLLAGTGLMVRSFLSLHEESLAVDAAGLTTMGVRLSSAKYPTPGDRRAFYEEVEARLGTVGAVDAFTMASVNPLGFGYARSLSIDGRPAEVGVEPPRVTYVTVGSDYFRTLGLPVLRGARVHAAGRDRGSRERRRQRAFRDDVLSRRRSHRPADPADEPERDGRGAAVADDRRRVADGAPDGTDRGASGSRRLLPLSGRQRVLRPAHRAELAGIGRRDRDSRGDAPAQPRPPALRGGTARRGHGGLAMEPALAGRPARDVRGRGASARRGSACTPSSRTRWRSGPTRSGYASRSARPPRRSSGRSVTEPPLRSASACSPASTGAGVLGRTLEAFLVGIEPFDAATLLVVAALLAGVVLVASLVPARRAAGVDPLTALRCE